MGIHGLMKLLQEEAPGSVKEVPSLEALTGRKVAIDASMVMYQFLVAVRSMGEGSNHAGAQLTNEDGDITSHVQGMFNRTIKLMTSGVRPVYVFDGKPPDMKGGELAKRLARREKAEQDLAVATAADDADDIDKFSRRLVKVTRQHNDDCKKLLRLMGIPVVEAPCEAEAQCAELARKDKVYATATEDMDALTFRTPKLLRRLTFSQSKSTKDKQPIIEIDYEAAMSGLQLTYEQFVDMCILCGCDYCSSIKGIGPKTALKLVRQFGTLEKIVEHLKKEKHELPDDWFPQLVQKEEEKHDVSASEVATKESSGEGTMAAAAADANESTELAEAAPAEAEMEEVPPLFVQARHLFTNCDVTDASEVELKWTEPDEDGLRTYLVDKMGFNPDRVDAGIKRLRDAQMAKQQKRMDSFFVASASVSSSTLKRKVEEGAAAGKGKPGKANANKKAKAGQRRR